MGKSEKTIDELTPIDDVLFQKLVESEVFCEELLRIILELPDLEVIKSEPQKNLRNIQGRSVILDALCTSKEQKYFNIEVQKADNDDHQRRVRYNGSNMDTYITETGVKFSELPDAYVIYISKFDFYKKGKTIYHIDRVIRETGDVVDNGFYEIYVNTAIDDGSDIAGLMQLFVKSDLVSDKRYPEFCKQVRYFKEEKGREDMCDAVEKYAQEIAKEAVKEAARKLFEKGMDLEFVKECITTLTLEELSEIQQSMLLLKN